jgi:diguanylate cyclase (GGDEF)-like protein
MVQVPEDISRRLKTCTSLHSPPPVAIKLMELASDRETALGTVADAIGGDPAIAVKVMRIANSKMYARRRQSANLRQALIVLGLNAALTLALTFTLVATLRKTPPKGFDFDAYWRRAILAGTWGKLLATELGRRDAEEVFLAAVLQDLGILAIEKIAPEVYGGISPFQLEHTRVTQHEKTQLQTDHRAVGAALLKDWNMPEQLSLAVQHSHDVTAAGVDGDMKGFVRAVAMSGDLADLWIGKRSEVAIRRSGLEAHCNLGILPNRLAELFDIIDEQLPVAEKIFEMELFQPDHLQEITEQARKILMIRNLHTIPENRDFEERKKALEIDRKGLQEDARRDHLTGVYNTRHFEESLTREFASAIEHKWPLSVVLVALDRFTAIKDINDCQAGDRLLQAVADMLKYSLRDTDVLARCGGDEFVLLLPGRDAAAADQVASRLMDSARGCTVAANGEKLHISLSVGTATQDSGGCFEKPADLLAAADQALSHSKRKGRNQHTAYAAIQAA